MRKEYIERSDVGPCLLERSDLLDLVSAVREGLPEEHGFEILAEFGNTQRSWDGVEEFLAYERLPDTPKELRFRAWYPEVYRSVREIDKNIHISFGFLGSSVTVVGSDETWVIGKHSQIRRFFDEKSTKVHFTTARAEKIIKSDLLVSVILGLWVVGVFNVTTNVELAYAILFSVSSVYLILKYLGWAKSWRPKRVKISLKSKRGFVLLGMEAKDAIPIMISILALIVSVVRLFLP